MIGFYVKTQQSYFQRKPSTIPNNTLSSIKIIVTNVRSKGTAVLQETTQNLYNHTIKAH